MQLMRDFGCYPSAHSAFLLNLGLTVAGALCYLPFPQAPGMVKNILFVAGYMIWDAFYTVANVPYGSMLSLISDDPIQRAQLSTFRSIGSMGGALLTGMLIPVIIYDNQNNLRGEQMFVIALIMGLIGLVCFRFMVTNTKVRVDTTITLKEDAPKFNIVKAFNNFISNLPKAGAYCVNKMILFWSFLFLILVIWQICTVLMKQMEKQTIHQMMSSNVSKHKNRKIYSLRHQNLTKILTKKFMFGRKETLIGILLSLSLGSVIFLGASYVTENTRKNNELTFKADDGLGSDIQLCEQSEQLSDVIPAQKIKEIKKISGIEEVHPVSYLLGELPLENGKLLWTSYFADIAEDESNPPDETLKEKYNGIAVRTGEDSYHLKVNIYGYDDEMIADLKPYLLEGTIDADEMKEKNLVILKTLVDGQGNYDGIDILAGDEIQLKTVKNLSVPEEALKFLGEESCSCP